MACSRGNGEGTWRGGVVAAGILRMDPVGTAALVTFLAGTATSWGQDIVAVLPLQTLLLQQLVHPLNDALKALVHIQPYFFLPNPQDPAGSALPRERHRKQTKPPPGLHLSKQVPKPP